MHSKTRQILEKFEEINKIPRCSKHEEKISIWLQNWAKTAGFDFKFDAVGNVLIKVPASKGYENSLGLVLQGHMDMVCEKRKGLKHDFSKDPIECVYAGDWLKGNGTSIGADDGIALAIGIVVAESRKTNEIETPPLELLFTVEEETGLTGALALEPGFFEGKILLNIDSEEEGIFTIGCAGGKNSRLSLPLKYEHFEYGKQGFGLFKLSVEGLKGGHSGSEIQKQRANAIKIVARSLELIRKELGPWGFGLISVFGGRVHNAIPASAEAYFIIELKRTETVEDLLSEFEKTLLKEYAETDPGLRLKLEKIKETESLEEVKETESLEDAKEIESLEEKSQNPKENSSYSIPKNQVLTSKSTDKVLNLLLALPHGVYRMSDKIPGLVETSNNLAVVLTDENEVKILSSQRSSVMSRLEEISLKLEAVANLAGAKIQHEDSYPAWEMNPESQLLTRCKEIYTYTFGKDPVIETIHAGLECGVIGSKDSSENPENAGNSFKNSKENPNTKESLESKESPAIDMISIGPTIRGNHSPEEKIYIPSIEKIWFFLENLLKSYKDGSKY